MFEASSNTLKSIHIFRRRVLDSVRFYTHFRAITRRSGALSLALTLFSNFNKSYILKRAMFQRFIHIKNM